MNMYESIKSKIYRTIHRNKKPIDQIADEIGISTESLYRYGLPTTSGSDMPLKRLVPLMKTTRDYSILKHIATLCGFVLVKMPRYRANKGDSNTVISNYQEANSRAVNKLIQFFKIPNVENYNNVKEALNKVMEESVGTRKYVDKEFAGQIEIFGE